MTKPTNPSLIDIAVSKESCLRKMSTPPQALTKVFTMDLKITKKVGPKSPTSQTILRRYPEPGIRRFVTYAGQSVAPSGLAIKVAFNVGLESMVPEVILLRTYPPKVALPL